VKTLPRKSRRRGLDSQACRENAISRARLYTNRTGFAIAREHRRTLDPSHCGMWQLSSAWLPAVGCSTDVPNV